MNVHHLQPEEKLAAHVDRILVIESFGSVKPFSLPLFANGVPTILFKSKKGTIGKKSAGYLTLFGQTVFPETLTLSGDFTLIAYFLKPYSLFSLFGITAEELTNNPVDLNLIETSMVNSLSEQLLNAGNLKAKLTLLDDYVFALIEKSKPECMVLKYATIKIAGNATKECLREVQSDLQISERKFERLFKKEIGIAPNLFRRICQFNAGFTQLNNRNFRKLSDIAFENGFSDQSHYIRSFKEFTNITPKEYLNFGAEL